MNRYKLYRRANAKKVWCASAVCGARKRSRRTGAVFLIDVTYIRSITPDVCPVFGTTFAFIGNKTPQPCSPSLDRLDPTKGYVEGNIAVISHRANLIKTNATLAEIQQVVAWLEQLYKERGDAE